MSFSGCKRIENNLEKDIRNTMASYESQQDCNYIFSNFKFCIMIFYIFLKEQ